jgi:phage tail-like protein
MTQSFRPTVSLATTSAELPIAWDLIPMGSGHLETEAPTNSLVLFPGKSGEILLRTRNNGTQNIHLWVEVEGDFPNDWLSDSRWQGLGVTRSRWRLALNSLAPREHISERITFTVPDTFFEQQRALVQDRHLTLEHRCFLYLYGALNENDSGRLVGYQTVDFYVRPNTTYLDFLPEIYQQSDFLGRFLSIFEQAFDPTMQVMDTFWAYLNPLTAPEALLPFLAEWVAWPMNPHWTVRQQRRLIRHAVEIYQWRGTRRGLQLVLSLITDLPQDDHHIDIVEDQGVDFVLGKITLAESPSLGGGRAFHFSVTLRPDDDLQASSLDETIIRAMIEQEKPAFCTYDLEIVWPT